MFLEALDDHHNPLFWFRWIPTIIIGGYLLQRYFVALVNQPKFTKQDIVYQEYFASGGSNKNILTKMGGASGCLRLVVTKDLLWVTSWLPFSLFAAAYDLEHVIPLRRIRSIAGAKTMGMQNLVLTYADAGGTSHALRLRPKNTPAFLNALETSSARSGTTISAANVVPEEPVPSLNVALKRYWLNLLVMGLFPTVFFVGSGYFHIPFGFMIPVFFASTIYGQWPIMRKRVPYMFQFVLGAVWLGGGIVGVAVTAFISFLFKSYHP